MFKKSGSIEDKHILRNLFISILVISLFSFFAYSKLHHANTNLTLLGNSKNTTAPKYPANYLQNVATKVTATKKKLGTLNLATTLNIKNLPAPDKDLHFFIDGWSKKALKGQTLTLSITNTNLIATAEIKPVSKVQLIKYIGENPKVFMDILARLMNVNSSFTCQGDNCQINGVKFSLAKALTSPHEIPFYGTLYQSLGIDNLVYQVIFKVPHTLTQFTISNGISKTFILNNSKLNPSPLNGYGSNLYAIGYGYGQIFPIYPVWRVKDNLNYVAEYLTAGQVKSANLGFPGGVDESSVAESLSLNASQYTFFTSPSTTCGGFGLCTFDSHYSKSLTQVKNLRLCDSRGVAADGSITTYKINLLGEISRYQLINSLLNSKLTSNVFYQTLFSISDANGVNNVFSSNTTNPINWSNSLINSTLNPSYHLC